MSATPMMQQYRQAKEYYKDAILFFQLGDFYEMFNDDAVLVSKELGLTLTKRQKTPMCGVPHHAGENYVQRLINKGYKVAIVDQFGDPKCKGLTERKIVRVITPGTILTDDAMTNANNNYIVIVSEANKELVLAGADISTGECFYGLYDGEERLQLLLDEIYRLYPSELLTLNDLSFQKTFNDFITLKLPNTITTTIAIPEEGIRDLISQHFQTNIPSSKLATNTINLLLSYIHKTVMTDLQHLSHLTRLDIDHLILDPTALKNLEITRNLNDGSKKNTLFDVLDCTNTPMGTRLLKKWLEIPLTNPSAINDRLDAVEELVKEFAVKNKIRGYLKSIYDLERLMTKVEIGTANAIDLNALKHSMTIIPDIKQALANIQSHLLTTCRDCLGNYDDLVQLIYNGIVDNPGNSIKDGNIIKEGYSQELDEYRHLSHDSKLLLQDMENREREATGIKYLKIGYTKVFGYYIEVRNNNNKKIPPHYIRKQTLVNAERYVTEELKDFETKILGAQERILTLEYNLFLEIRNKIKEQLLSIQTTAKNIAIIDVIACLAESASSYGYIRPQIGTDGTINIQDGRHPVIERIFTQEMFVPNNTHLNHSSCEIAIVTGPNMAGKSTYMRQIALLTLMTQIGSFIPARSASITPVDRIFTRIGASDDLVSGQSTFMVEMNEVAQILKYATANSLIILDEVGRGTSTFDGMSIAKAVIEYISKHIHAKTLFATHYHELTDLENDTIKNFSVAVKERDNDIIFLRRIMPGGADKSYGLQVAKLAELPEEVMQRAEKILKELETKNVSNIPVKVASPSPDKTTSTLIQKIQAIDIHTLTPIEAMSMLYQLQQMCTTSIES